MLKSLEDYLSGLSFDPPNPEPGKLELNSGERVFVEKYLGVDALRRMPVQEPEPVPIPQLLPKPQESRQAPRPQVIVALPAPVIKVAAVDVVNRETVKTPDLIIAEQETPAAATEKIEVETSVKSEAPTAQKVAEVAQTKMAVIPPLAESVKSEANAGAEIKIAAETTQKAAIRVPAESTQKIVEKSATEIKATAPTMEKAVEDTAAPAATEIATKALEQTLAQTETLAQTKEKTVAVKATATAAKIATKNILADTTTVAAAKETALTAELSLREKMRQSAEIQAVSFLVAGQIFLLPVAGIQEVLRYMELVKVPQAPSFVAGAINLRGTVMPLIHLSALLTNSATWKYDEKSFIIVTGSTSMQMGLIIDRVSSMHMIPQAKIIWNAESKLGEAAEFLSAIVDLDDKVCGMIAPEVITQKLISEM